MEARAVKKYVRLSPGKLRPVARGIKNLLPDQARVRLSFAAQKGARELAVLIGEAVNNAVSRGLKRENLRFKTIEVNEGPRIKRGDKSHGARFNPGTIHKRMAHLKIILSENGSGS